MGHKRSDRYESSEEQPGDLQRRRKRDVWSVQEDENLIELVRVHGTRNWSKIASFMPCRVGKQCRERYFNHLAPDVCKDVWTPEEDCQILHVHHSLGNKWTRISMMIPTGRSPNAIKNRWHSSLKVRLWRFGGEDLIMSRLDPGASCECGCTSCHCNCLMACLANRCTCCMKEHWYGSENNAEEDKPELPESAATADEADDQQKTSD